MSRSQKWRQEWSFFIGDSGRRKYNRFCVRCVHSCKPVSYTHLDVYKRQVQNGWKAIEELFKASLKTKEKDDPMKSLPDVYEGDVLDGVSASVTEHFTTPPKQYTDCLLFTSRCV